MIAPPTHLRYERKFIASGCNLTEALAMIRLHPAAFREAYPPRAVNNIYLDSPALRDYHNHVSGTANRLKTRIRWYGEATGPVGKPTLERKIKFGAVSGKKACPLPPFQVNGGLAPRVLRDVLDQATLPDGVRGDLRHLSPALFNRYQRHYFQSMDGRLRLTADSDLQFCGVRGDTGAIVPLGMWAGGIILELKYDPEQALGAAEAANVLRFRMSRCSKYVLGIERLLVALPHS